MKTLVAMVRVPDNVAEGMKYGRGSLAWWVAEGVRAFWESDFDDTEEEWPQAVARRFGCRPADRERMLAYDAGFVEADGEAEREVARLIAARAAADAPPSP